MANFTITQAKLDDQAAIAALYRAVAAVEGGLARNAAEITDEYINHFLRSSLESGLILVARQGVGGQVVGEIHAYALGPQVFAHVLGELTIAVHPANQGQGIGKALFTELLRRVEEERPEIRRIELIARESNQKAIALYQRLGFQIEGRLVGRIRSVDGGYEADIPMAWRRNAI
jgi:ribosomal protein S18 acetylase RimI-like enzyme